MAQSRRVRLTQREVQVLTLISKGFTNREIAGLLRISAHTVSAHNQNIYVALGAVNRTHAVSIFLVQQGFIAENT